MESLIERVNTISELINEGNEENLNNIFLYYKDKMNEFKQDFRVLAINSDIKLKEATARLLNSLNIPIIQATRYINSPLSFYNLLIELRDHNQNNNDKIKLFIKIIDNQDKIKWSRILLLGLGGILTITFLYPVLLDLWRLTAIQNIITSALFAPVMGIVFTCGFVLSSLNNIFKDKKQTFTDKLNEVFFLLAGNILQLAAYGALLTAGMSSQPIMAILFVASSVTNVLKESFSLLIKLNEKTKLGKIHDKINLIDAQQLIRLKNDMKKNITSIMLNLAESSVISISLAVMYFVPGGSSVIIASVMAMISASIIKMIMNTQNEKFMRVRLGEKFSIYEERALKTSNDLALVDDLENRVAMDDLPSPSKRSVEISPKKSSPHSKASVFGFFSTSGIIKERNNAKKLDFIAPEDMISCGA